MTIGVATASSLLCMLTEQTAVCSPHSCMTGAPSLDAYSNLSDLQGIEGAGDTLYHTKITVLSLDDGEPWRASSNVRPARKLN